MIARVWDQVVLTPSVDQTVVATDSDKIADFCKANDMDAVMTRSDHPTGSDRLAEVAEKISEYIYINVQGDEPLIDRLHRCSLQMPFGGGGTRHWCVDWLYHNRVR